MGSSADAVLCYGVHLGGGGYFIHDFIDEPYTMLRELGLETERGGYLGYETHNVLAVKAATVNADWCEPTRVDGLAIVDPEWAKSLETGVSAINDAGRAWLKEHADDYPDDEFEPVTASEPGWFLLVSYG